uniref:Uncharacterized protein n=1 Tax=Amphimedon queenslandica TaxID=400682 RepID=A0A1X7UG79_AMPQE
MERIDQRKSLDEKKNTLLTAMQETVFSDYRKLKDIATVLSDVEETRDIANEIMTEYGKILKPEEERGTGGQCMGGRGGGGVSSMKDGNDGVFSLRGSSVIEHGVLVSCTMLSTRGGGVGGGAKNIHGSLANPPILNYWIIGRLFEERELYICYQENMSQSSVEIIFKLLFGSNIF